MTPAAMDGRVEPPASTHDLVIDFMFLDLETCTRCRATDANLDAGLAEVGQILEMAGRDVAVRKTLVASAEQAHALGFVSSPTIRLNGKDIALELRESNCGECGDACACDGSVDCRVWVWQDQEHTAAPRAMIVDAILREVYGGSARAVASAPPAALPENLERYFAGKDKDKGQAVLIHAAEPAACCSPAQQASCCEPSEKAACCGEGTSGSCGCQ